jgi:hypothetical protein
VIEIYNGDKLQSTVTLVDGKITVVAAPGNSQQEQEEFVQSLRRNKMTDDGLYKWLTKRLRSHVYAVEK